MLLLELGLWTQSPEYFWTFCFWSFIDQPLFSDPGVADHLNPPGGHVNDIKRIRPAWTKLWKLWIFVATRLADWLELEVLGLWRVKLIHMPWGQTFAFAGGKTCPWVGLIFRPWRRTNAPSGGLDTTEGSNSPRLWTHRLNYPHKVQETPLAKCFLGRK